MHFTGTIWRPPYEAYSLLIQVTVGCTHHSCKFCTLYADLDRPFCLSPIDEVTEDLQEASRYQENTKRIFFTGGNPFALSVDKLKQLAELARENLPDVQTFGCFARITDIVPKTVEQLKELRALGYDGLTIGVETGDDQALAFMRKGYAASDIITQCQKLDEAGISYSFFYLTGISGAGKGESGAAASAQVFNQTHPAIIAPNMLTVYEGSELYQEIQAGNWEEEMEIEKLKEVQALIRHLAIDTAIITMGSSNLVQIRGELPRDKEKLLRYLDHVIQNADEQELRRYRTTLPSL